MTTTIDAPFFELTADLPTRPLPSTLATARDDVLAAARDLLAIPEAALPKPWAWKGGSEEEVRYGAYRAAELMEGAELEARRLMAPLEADGTAGGTAHRTDDLRHAGTSTACCSRSTTRLLDADPGGGEWTIRLTLGHIISGQRGYGWGSAWWQAQSYAPDDPALPARAPDSLRELLPDEATTEAAGTLDDLRARLDAVTDLTSERLAGMPDDRVDLGSRWAGFAVTLGFRFGRWSSHIREHVIQLEKTFAMLGHEPSEPARLVRNLLAAYGRAKSTVFVREGADAAAERIARAAVEARDTTAAARLAADA